ncbi:pyridoxamine 5'-phosphate oxidase family protein [Gryllotalpicola protaetiae]|uniref:Pyridoxamine 5'-phosphate oxidase family protein n=1 Tax=Gryllotalpicola protaetiae TaxID=2419771 RepID=A0A387BP53_9MICO|nr:pyridoxamine 5'-phosphate oxidase family protein [Gryllotalpicola protaetiae]AYG02780.1 pyridoxamine 5'-phosphate oxidase family protein [Gryllotalpicola protaetiae]
MFETDDEVAALQALLDRSMAGAGPHLREIFDGARLSAHDLVERMPGMQLLTVATVSRDGRPYAGAVDGYLLHGELWFGSGTQALRTRHLRRNPAVSATWLPDAQTQLTVHGEVEIVPFAGERAAPLRQAMLDHYVPIEGPEWARFLDDLVDDDSPAFRIIADKAFAYYRAPRRP